MFVIHFSSDFAVFIFIFIFFSFPVLSCSASLSLVFSFLLFSLFSLPFSPSLLLFFLLSLFVFFSLSCLSFPVLSPFSAIHFFLSSSVRCPFLHQILPLASCLPFCCSASLYNFLLRMAGAHTKLFPLQLLQTRAMKFEEGFVSEPPFLQNLQQATNARTAMIAQLQAAKIVLSPDALTSVIQTSEAYLGFLFPMVWYRSSSRSFLLHFPRRLWASLCCLSCHHAHCSWYCLCRLISCLFFPLCCWSSSICMQQINQIGEAIKAHQVPNIRVGLLDFFWSSASLFRILISSISPSIVFSSRRVDGSARGTFLEIPVSHCWSCSRIDGEMMSSLCLSFFELFLFFGLLSFGSSLRIIPFTRLRVVLSCFLIWLPPFDWFSFVVLILVIDSSSDWSIVCFLSSFLEPCVYLLQPGRSLSSSFLYLLFSCFLTPRFFL